MQDFPTVKCSVLLGKNSKIKKISGKVINKEQWSETYVHGGGGGGTHGHNAPVRVSSTVVDKGTLWLFDQSGKELSWNMSNSGQNVRASHVLSVAAPLTGKNFLALYNHNLDKFDWYDDNVKAHVSPPNFVFWILVLVVMSIIWMSAATSFRIDGEFYFVMAVVAIIVTIVGAIAWGIFVFIRKTIFTLKHKSMIKEFLQEGVDL